MLYTAAGHLIPLCVGFAFYWWLGCGRERICSNSWLLINHWLMEITLFWASFFLGQLLKPFPLAPRQQMLRVCKIMLRWAWFNIIRKENKLWKGNWVSQMHFLLGLPTAHHVFKESQSPPQWLRRGSSICQHLFCILLGISLGSSPYILTNRSSFAKLRSPLRRLPEVPWLPLTFPNSEVCFKWNLAGKWNGACQLN